MILQRYELKKILINQKGLLILGICLITKIIFLLAIPEWKDDRILLSQKQYDKYLEQLYGENTEQKGLFIEQEYEQCRNTIQRADSMQKEYQQGKLSEKEWEVFQKELDRAYLHQNAIEIFHEKKMQFDERGTNEKPPMYMYEYGWQTIFRLQMYPDVFLMIGLILIASQCLSSEISTGVLPILLTARNGRRQLFLAKVISLSECGVIVGILNCVTEVMIFRIRGWLNDSQAMLYSINIFAKDCRWELSLGQGYALLLCIRIVVGILFMLVIYEVTIWLRGIINILFVALCLLAVPLSAAEMMGYGILFTHTGLLCGTRILLLTDGTIMNLVIPLIIIMIYSGTGLIMAQCKYRRGI